MPPELLILHELLSAIAHRDDERNEHWDGIVWEMQNDGRGTPLKHPPVKTPLKHLHDCIAETQDAYEEARGDVPRLVAALEVVLGDMAGLQQLADGLYSRGHEDAASDVAHVVDHLNYAISAALTRVEVPAVGE